MENRGGESVVVAIDKDKMSQFALKWAVDNVLKKGKNVTLVHVKQMLPSDPTPGVRENRIHLHGRKIFLPFLCFMSRTNVKCEEVVLEDMDISKALIEYADLNAVHTMIIGAPSKNGFMSLRLKGADVGANVIKGAPDFCTVYVIHKGKVLNVKNATRPAPKNIVHNATPSQTFHNVINNPTDVPPLPPGDRSPMGCTSMRYPEDTNMIRSPFTVGRATNGRSYGEVSMPECDISFVSSSRTSTDRSSIDRASFETMDFSQGPRLSSGSDSSYGSSFRGRTIDLNSFSDSSSYCSGFSPASSLNMSGFQDNVDSEMRRLRQQLKQTTDMYNTACKEALTAKQKALELEKSKLEDDRRFMTLAVQEQNECKAAFQAAEAAQRIADLEAQKRTAELNVTSNKESMEKKVINVSTRSDVRYRRYSIEEIEIASDYFSESLKIGEGGYGPVYHCTLDHTPVAIKVLRPDAAQGEEQFQQEVEILSSIRHPNMVLLLGACPEYGCLVYEYMSNGSLEDRLFRKGNTPPLPWQLRFRIAEEIAKGLLFLHQSKPEPLVHRDLKPANILIDRNYVSKISDVGLARLVPPSIADSVTQYRLTQAAGTFCYIDPEYQQTGMLGTNSDIYSLGILYLQLITAKQAMGLTHIVQRAIENGTFREILDPCVPDWPYKEALEFALLSLKCAELSRKDRPDLLKILPTLVRLSQFGDESMPNFMFFPMPSLGPTSVNSVSVTQTLQDVINERPSIASEVSVDDRDPNQSIS